TTDAANSRTVALRRRIVLAATLALLSLVLSTTGAKGASQGSAIFASTSSTCSASWSHDVHGVLNIENPLPIAPRPLGPPLFNRHESAGDGPQCPARAGSATEQATATASASLDGGWSVDLTATKAAGTA